MNKYIILSVDQNEDYVYHLPLCVWTWIKAGFEPIIIFRGAEVPFVTLALDTCGYDVYHVAEIDGIRNSTIAQSSRLYASAIPFEDHDYLLLGDCDMLALGNHWNPGLTNVTVYNHDLTGHTEIPMCYAGAPVRLWREIMGLNSISMNDAIHRDLADYPNAKSDDFYKWWGCDQQILTDRLQKYGYDKITFIDRGPSDLHGYARGRVDRAPGGWRFDLPELIDAHLIQQVHHRQERVQNVLDLLKHVWPAEDWTWWLNYTEEFRKLTGHTA